MKIREVRSMNAVRAWFANNTGPIKVRARPTVAKDCGSVEEAKKFLDYMKAPAPNTNEIFLYFHCKRCMAEKPDDLSPREWASLEVGMTPHGVQVWCKRHSANVIHIDFEGHRHPSNETCKNDEH